MNFKQAMDSSKKVHFRADFSWSLLGNLSCNFISWGSYGLTGCLEISHDKTGVTIHRATL